MKRGHTLAYARKHDKTSSEVADEDTLPGVKDSKDSKDDKEPKTARDRGEKVDKADKLDKPSDARSKDAVQPAVEPAVADTKPLAVDDLVRARVATIGMPSEQPVGTPPEMPAAAIANEPASARHRVAPSDVEDPTFMPGPREVPAGRPEDPAPAPGLVPPGDSRSLRRQHDFALIYRQGNAVIVRFGAVGTRGQWRVVEYPTSASASHAYAKECSRFVSEGFSDYRG